VSVYDQGVEDGALMSSRTPSRSPHRSQTESAIGTSTPSTRPAEPTIREETQASVSKTLSARHVQAPPDTAPLSGHASRSGAPSASSNGTPRSKSKYRMVGDWQLQKTLGAGSMGKVKLGLNIHTREKVSERVTVVRLMSVCCKDYTSIHRTYTSRDCRYA